MASVLVSLFFVGFLPATPHELPDGVVKISTQVIVQADATTVTYDVGVNPNTLALLLKEIKIKLPDDATMKAKLDAFKKAFKPILEKSLVVKANGHAVQVTEILYEPDEIAKHVQARFKLTYEIPIKKETKLEFEDSNFKNHDRIWNAGFKSAIPVAVKESSTKAIPIRSRPQEKSADNSAPFVVTGTVVKLDIAVEPEESVSLAPFFVAAFALGGAALSGLLMVPGDPDDGHDDHH